MTFSSLSRDRAARARRGRALVLASLAAAASLCLTPAASACLFKRHRGRCTCNIRSAYGQPYWVYQAPAAAPPVSSASSSPDYWPPTATKNLHVVMVLTDGDSEIGQAADVDAHLLGALLGDQLDRSRLVPPVVLRESDNQLTHEAVLSTIRNLQVNPDDALLFFYAGPGTYDQQGEYYLRLHGGRPMARKDLMNELSQKQARLTVLLTDSCTRPLGSADEEVPLLAQGTEPITLYWLLMAHSGVVDIDACSPGERGYYQRAENVAVTPISGETGGSIFMREFFKECRLGQSAGKKDLTWQEFFNTLQKDVALSVSVAAGEAPPSTAGGELPKPQTPHAFQIATQVDKMPEPSQTVAASTAAAALVVRVPDGAAVYLDDQPTSGEGNERAFVTPPLAAGYDYIYQVKIELAHGSQRWSETRIVPVRPGWTTTVEFNPPAAAVAAR